MDFPKSVPSVGLVDGKFVDEDPVLGTPGSLIPAQWGNAVTEEVLNVIEAAGLTPDEENNAQLLAAIRQLSKVPPLLNDIGAVNAYAAANSPALTSLPTTGYIQQVKIANGNTGASTYAPDGLAAKPIYGLGLQPLQGGELPAGVAVLMYLVQASVNGGSGAWILIDSLGGSQQVAPATKSQHAIQLSQAQAMFSAPIGTASNLKMTVNAASASASITADEIIVGIALGGQNYRLSGFNKTVDLSTTGAGGMDTGLAPVNGYVALYAIYNPTTGVSAVLAVNGTSTVMPSIYGGANMPAGYTASALLTVVPTNASRLIKVCYVYNRTVHIQLATGYSGTTVVTLAAVSIAGAVPPNARSVFGELQTISSASTTMSLSVVPDTTQIAQQNISGVVSAGAGTINNFANVPITINQTIYVTTSTTAGTLTSNVYIGGYSI